MPQPTRATTRALTPLLSVAVAAGALFATPTAAEAKSYVRSDARGDMTEMSVSPHQPRPDDLRGDIVRIRVRHTANRVQVRIVFADLVKSPDFMYETAVLFRTNEAVGRHVIQIDSVPHNWQPGFVRWIRYDGQPARCAVHRSHDFVHHVILFGFPRRCLSNPRWIRVRVQMTTARNTGGTMGFAPLLEDDAFRTGIGPDIPSPLSPRIRRG